MITSPSGPSAIADIRKPSPASAQQNQAHTHTHTIGETSLPYYEGKHDIAMATIIVRNL